MNIDDVVFVDIFMEVGVFDVGRNIRCVVGRINFFDVDLIEVVIGFV